MFCHECSLLLQLLLLLITSELATAEVYYVTPNNHFSLSNYTNVNTLQYYLDNSKTYFSNLKDIQLHFLSGIHYINKNFVIKKSNFMLIGNGSVIECSNRQVGVSVKNAVKFIMQNITLVQCNMKHDNIRNYSCATNTTYNWNAALFLQECDSVSIINVSIIVNASINGLVAVNNHMKFNITNLVVHVKCSLNNVSLPYTNGLVLYSYFSKKRSNTSYYIFNYTYKPDNLCSKVSLQCALTILLTQSRYNTYVKISDTTFRNLHNVTVLNYCGKSHAGSTQKIWNIIAFYNCKISRNTGTSLSKMFSFIIHGNGYSFGSENEKNAYRGHYNILKFYYCIFSDNSNFKSLLHILAKNTLSSNTIMKIDHCNMCCNHMVTILEIVSEVKVYWQITLFVNIASTDISSNTHTDGHNLLSAANAIIKLSDFVDIKNNSYYYSIFMLHLSELKFYGYIEIFGNHVKHVFRGKASSYYLVNENAKIIITHNILFSILSQSKIYNEHYQQMCYFQFYSNNDNLDELIIHNQSINYEIVVIDNIYTAPIHILKRRNIFPSNCLWLVGTAFQMVNSSAVYDRIVNRTLKTIDRDNIGIIPSSICECVNSTEYKCTSHELGKIYPGQTISTKLIIPRLIIPQNSVTLRVLNQDLPQNGCRVTNANEISQRHAKPTCNEYNYTIWSNKSSCELYLDSADSMEIFYVDLQPCPLGFSLQEDKHGCVCDHALNSDIISVTSCNLNDATILRPANSWIFAIKNNYTQYYKVSSNCPLNYCLQTVSNLNLSAPDSQCQFNRSGVLCGHCQEGLSAIFGSSECKQCSNVYLLIIIPIILAGMVLVTMLFIFNITISNGIINTFIFYVNIISINFSMFFPQCDSVVSMFISLANLDLGIKTCFYDGMNGYAKMWLQLTFPVYLFLIAHLLILGSRYSSRIQRLTAQKALPVLATLLLLSYTKILLTVCRVLFFFSSIIHLPSRYVEYTWSVDTSIHLFGTKFCILFAICLMLFTILLPFNCLLLFIKPLSCLKLVNKFKPLLDVYRGPYKDQYCYWTGLYLLMRAAFFGLSAFDRRISLACGIILLGILLCIQGILHPFKCTLTNIQESIILLNLLSIYVVAYYSNRMELKIVQFLITIVLVYFTIFITCHCIMSACGETVGKKLKKASWITILWKRKKAKGKYHSKTLNGITDDDHDYIEFQEPLIALETYM